jgi:5-methylcytosine-specific restriction enzyme A
MARAVQEWIGKTDDHRAPGSVRDRLKLQFPNCNICGRRIEATESMALDHVVALINGGENREGNLRPVHQSCHAIKSADDVGEKSRVAAKRKKHHGLVVDKPNPIQGQPMPTTRKAFERKQRPPKPQLPPRSLYARGALLQPIGGDVDD